MVSDINYVKIFNERIRTSNILLYDRRKRIYRDLKTCTCFSIFVANLFEKNMQEIILLRVYLFQLKLNNEMT